MFLGLGLMIYPYFVSDDKIMLAIGRAFLSSGLASKRAVKKMRSHRRVAPHFKLNGLRACARLWFYRPSIGAAYLMPASVSAMARSTNEIALSRWPPLSAKALSKAARADRKWDSALCIAGWFARAVPRFIPTMTTSITKLVLSVFIAPI
jgi:hypothetical protein